MIDKLFVELNFFLHIIFELFSGRPKFYCTLSNFVYAFYKYDEFVYLISFMSVIGTGMYASN